MILTVMLDVDGVLVTGRPLDGAFWSQDLRRDLGLDPDLLRDCFFRPFWPRIVVGELALRDALEAIWQDLGSSTSIDEFISYWFRQDSRIDQTVLSGIATLRQNGHTVWLATNQEHERASYLMTDLGLDAHVDGLVYSADIGARKPDRLFFEKATSLAGGSHFVLVDDTIANVKAARSAGWHAVHWTGAETLKDALRDVADFD